MSQDVLVPGPRDVRGSLDGPVDASGCVVACPPHPQAGGTRSNPVLTALGEELDGRGLATLRFDYGPWDDGEGEVGDAKRAIDWAAERFLAVGLFGYSFGGSVAVTAAVEAPIVGVSVLAPGAGLPNLDTVTALERVTVPLQVLYGDRDRVVDSGPVVDRAREIGHAVAALPADHHFVGQQRKVARRVADFFVEVFDVSPEM